MMELSPPRPGRVFVVTTQVGSARDGRVPVRRFYRMRAYAERFAAAEEAAGRGPATIHVGHVASWNEVRPS